MVVNSKIRGFETPCLTKVEKTLLFMVDIHGNQNINHDDQKQLLLFPSSPIVFAYQYFDGCSLTAVPNYNLYNCNSVI